SLINLEATAAEEAIKLSGAEAKLNGPLPAGLPTKVPPITTVTCEVHNKSKTKCLEAQCKWGGKKDDDGPCQASDKQVSEQTKQGGRDTTTGGDVKKEDKCTGKDEKTCGGTQGCKWEGTECKDFSLLVNNKISIIVSVSVSLVAF
ncbi:variant surface glycoprotein (VSG), putative, partial [Trypanosoma brucei brucei TREU927]